MWFDVRAKLAEIEAHPSATSATPATMQANLAHCVAEVASVATPLRSTSALRVAKVADVATPSAADQRTWTGRVVSLVEWQRLSDWERNGPNGRHWCGLCREWHAPRLCKGGCDD